MPEWADISVSDEDVRAALKEKALFFVPKALPVVGDVKPAAFITYAAASKQTGADFGVGRSAIIKVIRCTPVILSSALGVIELINGYFVAQGQTNVLSSKDIVACVFRLRDFGTVLSQLGENADSISRKTGIRLPIVNSALRNQRLQYCDAKAIYDTCRSLAAEKAIELDLLSDEISDFVTPATRADAAAAVGRVANRDGDERYVYERPDLKSAPPSGHPWCIE